MSDRSEVDDEDLIGLHCAGVPTGTLPGPTGSIAALLKLVTDWNPVQDPPWGLGGFFVFFLLHLYSVDLCNGCKINVCDVPVNVNKIKFILKGIFLISLKTFERFRSLF